MEVRPLSSRHSACYGNQTANRASLISRKLVMDYVVSAFHPKRTLEWWAAERLASLILRDVNLLPIADIKMTRLKC